MCEFQNLSHGTILKNVKVEDTTCMSCGAVHTIGNINLVYRGHLWGGEIENLDESKYYDYFTYVGMAPCPNCEKDEGNLFMPCDGDLSFPLRELLRIENPIDNTVNLM